jgi:acetyl esterase/lipase
MFLSLLKVFARRCIGICLVVLVLLACTKTSTNPKSNATPVFEFIENTLVESSIIYKESENLKLMLDVYTPVENLGEEPWIKRAGEPKPTLIYFHGGGWASGDRISRAMYVLPYVQKGWAVVNADYRLLGQTNLPGCIEDCLNVVDWTFKNAEKYRFDTTRVVVSGESAGGHLALMSGMLMPKMKGNIKPHKLAAIINWYGVSDLHTAVAYWNAPDYIDIVTRDFESNPDVLYTNSSPVNNISPDTPPIISIHGDQDRNHPFSQSRQLHEALDKAQIPNELVKIPGKKHGNFTAAELEHSFNEIWKFLDQHLNPQQ